MKKKQNSIDENLVGKKRRKQIIICLGRLALLIFAMVFIVDYYVREAGQKYIIARGYSNHRGRQDDRR